jgi:GTP cyclohydrolase II
MIIRLAERDLQTRFGTFNEVLYYDGQQESIALVMGNVANTENVLCRIHSACLGGHVFNSIECECAGEMASAQAAIQREGRGVIIYLDQEGKGNGHLALMQSISFKKAGDSQADAYVKAGFAADNRSYRVVTGILADLKARSIVLLSNGAAKADALRSESVIVADIMPMTNDAA